MITIKKITKLKGITYYPNVELLSLGEDCLLNERNSMPELNQGIKEIVDELVKDFDNNDIIGIDHITDEHLIYMKERWYKIIENGIIHKLGIKDF